MVCTDQWLVTHVDPSWPVSQLKHELLRKFSRERKQEDKNYRSIPVSPSKTRRRSLSPITFAAPVRKGPLVTAGADSPAGDFNHQPQEQGFDADLDDEEDDEVDLNKSFTDAHRYKYNTRPSTSSVSDPAARSGPADSAEADQEAAACVLISFSTTQILEDRFSLEWYGVQPGELLELHPLSHSFVSLPRYSLDAYIAPYFAARVWALRVIGSTLESSLRDLGVPRDHQTDDEITDASPRSPFLRDKGKKKVTLEWKERWAVIHQGIFSLCKERHDVHHAAFSAPLSNMLCIQDGTQFELPLRSSRRTRSLPNTKTSLSTSSDIVCVKFADTHQASRQRTMSGESLSTPWERHSSDALTSPVPGAWWRRGSRDVSTTLSSSLASSASALMGSPSGTGFAEMWDAFARRGSRSGLDDSECEGDDAIWIVLDMLNSAAQSHILRVLHRHAPPTCDSSFLPSRPPSRSVPSPIVFSTRTSSPMSPDLPTPGPASVYTFPPASSPAPSPPQSPFPGSASSHPSNDEYPFPRSPVAPAPPTRPVTPARPPQLRIDTHAIEHGVPYPDWRLALVRKARRAGLGAVGRAMELVMFGDEDDEDAEGEEDDELEIEWARRLSAIEASPSPIEPLPSMRSRPRPARHVSDPAGSFSASPDTQGEFDAPQPDPCSADDSDESEAEWEGWLDVTIAERRREQLASRAIQRTDTLETAVPDDLYWGTSFYGQPGSPSPAASTPENERADPWTATRSRSQSASEAEGDTEDGSSMHSTEVVPKSRPSSYYGYHPPAVPSSRGRRAKQKQRAIIEHGGGRERTLSSYSSADSLLKRTMRTAMGGSTKASYKRASTSSSEMNLRALNERPPHPPRSASASPPLSRPSLGSLRSVGSTRSRPLSPLCQGSDTGHDTSPPGAQAYHPIPLPGMPIVPSGYTTFRHSALYARSSGRVGGSASAAAAAVAAEREEARHAGLAHGESMQRLPVPMSMMMTTVSSTVSVGTGKTGSASRWCE